MQIEIKQWIAHNVNDPDRSIGDANIDAVFGKVPAAPDHQSSDNLQPEKLKVVLFIFIFLYFAETISVE